MYHTPHTHASIVDIGLFREPKAQKRKDGATYWAHRGGGTTYKLPPGGFDERTGRILEVGDQIGERRPVSHETGELVEIPAAGDDRHVP